MIIITALASISPAVVMLLFILLLLEGVTTDDTLDVLGVSEFDKHGDLVTSASIVLS